MMTKEVNYPHDTTWAIQRNGGERGWRGFPQTPPYGA